MTKEERQKKIIEAVKKIVAQKGMNGFSIRQAAEMTGINEALIYRDFATKDHLLDTCYKSVQDDIALIFTELDPLDIRTPEQASAAMKNKWMRSFRYLLEHPENAVFIRNYRESSYREKLLEAGRRREPKYFFEAREKFIMFLPPQIDLHCTWIYINDLSLEFAVRMLNGELPVSEDSIETVWELMFHGLSSSVKLI